MGTFKPAKLVPFYAGADNHDYSGAFPKYLFNLHDGVASAETIGARYQRSQLQSDARGRVALMANAKVRQAFDVRRADSKVLDRY